MSLHKLSSGDGYTYLTRQVAAADETNRGYGSLGSYYEQKGESPGVWLGSGLDSLGGSVPEVPHFLVDQFVEDVVARVLSPELSVSLTPRRETDEPAALRRSDGSSVYEIAGSHRYSSTAILDAEQHVLAHAGRRDGRTLDPSTIALALLEGTANGVHLGHDQAAMVRELAGSGARVQLALAPAGTGKTITMRALAQAWTASGGNVIGLAPSAAAARVLGEELGDHATAADTLAKLVHALTTDMAVPAWFHSIDQDTLLIVDEAGMAGTLDLAAAVDHVISRGGSVRSLVTTSSWPPSAPAASCATSGANTVPRPSPTSAASPTSTAA